MNKENQRGRDGNEIALEARATKGAQLFSPSVGRNKDVILDAFQAMIPHDSVVLEIGSGSGEHGFHFCSHMTQLRWHPSDPDPTSRDSIGAWADALGDGRIASPLDIRTDGHEWWQHADIPDELSAIVSINMIHIAPWAAVEGLFVGAGSILPTRGKLFFYGPFMRQGEAAESNLRFDADLKRRNADWGVRDLDAQLIPIAKPAGLNLSEIRDMPNNNLCVVFEKQ